MQSNGPNDLLTIKDRELFMSFGLLHELLAEIGDLVRVGLIAVDPDLRSRVLHLVLSERDKRGVITEPVNLFDLSLATADVHRIINWVAEHTLGFFLDAIENAAKTHDPHLDRLKAPSSTHSGNGSNA